MPHLDKDDHDRMLRADRLVQLHAEVIRTALNIRIDYFTDHLAHFEALVKAADADPTVKTAMDESTITYHGHRGMVRSFTEEVKRSREALTELEHALYEDEDDEEVTG